MKLRIMGTQKQITDMKKLIPATFENIDFVNTEPFSGFKIDYLYQSVFYKGKKIQLTFIQFKIVSIFFINIDRLITREEILEAINHDVIVRERTVDTHLSRIRKLFRIASGEKYFDCISGNGYKFKV